MSLGMHLSHWIDRVSHLLGEDLLYFSASLSFYTIFSIIPMLWVMFFVLSQFDAFSIYYLGIRDFIVVNLIPTHTEAVSQYLDSFMENSNKMGLWGFVYIFVTSLLFYQNYQYVVNKIYLMPNQNLWHALITYLILALLMPLTLGISFYLSDYIQRVVIDYHVLGVFTVLSYFMIWMLFFVVFTVSPNMRISYRITLTVSFLVSLIWQIAKMGFVQYVVVNQTYASLYGSFSVLLFFLLWVYLSWFMLLHGLRLCYLWHCHSHH
ncbi:MAG TPA: YihY family inner membrane protein [Gammaproteobacteria bacterium]